MDKQHAAIFRLFEKNVNDMQPMFVLQPTISQFFPKNFSQRLGLLKDMLEHMDPNSDQSVAQFRRSLQQMIDEIEPRGGSHVTNGYQLCLRVFLLTFDKFYSPRVPGALFSSRNDAMAAGRLAPKAPDNFRGPQSIFEEAGSADRGPKNESPGDDSVSQGPRALR